MVRLVDRNPAAVGAPQGRPTPSALGDLLSTRAVGIDREDRAADRVAVRRANGELSVRCPADAIVVTGVLESTCGHLAGCVGNENVRWPARVHWIGDAGAGWIPGWAVNAKK